MACREVFWVGLAVGVFTFPILIAVALGFWAFCWRVAK